MVRAVGEAVEAQPPSPRYAGERAGERGKVRPITRNRSILRPIPRRLSFRGSLSDRGISGRRSALGPEIPQSPKLHRDDSPAPATRSKALPMCKDVRECAAQPRMCKTNPPRSLGSPESSSVPRTRARMCPNVPPCTRMSPETSTVQNEPTATDSTHAMCRNVQECAAQPRLRKTNPPRLPHPSDAGV